MIYAALLTELLSVIVPNGLSWTWHLSAAMLFSAFFADCSASVGELAGAGRSLLEQRTVSSTA